MDKKKKAYLLLCSYLLGLKLISRSRISYNEDYEYGQTGVYATYKNSDIYIGDIYTIREISNTNDNNVYIIDGRNFENPEMAICNSSEICNPNDMSNIIEILLKYEYNNPSNWDRQFYTMKMEWLVHNICYYFNIQSGRTGEVNLDNDDEKYYNFKYLNELVKNNYVKLVDKCEKIKCKK